jgi:hypothetical protein
MFDMYSEEGDQLVFRIADAARLLLNERGATMSEIDEFIYVNFKRLAVTGYPEVVDAIVLQNVYDHVFGL